MAEQGWAPAARPQLVEPSQTASGSGSAPPADPLPHLGPPELLLPTGPEPPPAQDPASSSLRASWNRLSLRRRLVLGLLLVVALALAGCGVATYAVLQHALVSQIDDGLTSVRNQALNSPGPGPAQRSVSDAIRNWQQLGASVYVVTSTSAQLLTVDYEGTSTSPAPVSASDLASLQSVPPGPHSPPVTIDLQGFGETRAVAVPVTLAGGGNANLVAALPLSRVDSVIRPFLAIELVALFVALLFVALAGSWWIRRSLRPLDRVAYTAGQVATLPLDRGDVTIPDRVPGATTTTEVGQVASAVNAMLDHVETSLRARKDTEDRLRQFVSDAGHELRTPLATVRGYAELVRRAGDAHPEQALASARRIESAAARMGILVEDLLLLASLDEGRPLERAEVDLAALTEDVVTEARTTAGDHEVVIGPLGPDVRVIGDPTRIHQVLTNLIANAVSYTPPGSTITASVLRVGSEVLLQVRDNGPGFPPELLPRATERFARGDGSRSRATGGSGLGLAIVRAIVESHGGHLTIENDRGAVVTAHFPG